MKNLSVLALFCIITVTCLAQGTISGTITDAESGLPLEGASVFAQNTTKGVITNKEGFFSFYLDKGGYEIGISFTGYASRTINLEVTGDRNFQLTLQKADNTLGEVVIKNSAELSDGWERYGSFFVNHFIGQTSNADSTQILNPEVLRFFHYKRNDRLKILASEPLQIENRALGYQVRYELDSFVHFFKTDLYSYKGKAFYMPLEGDSLQQLMWEKARFETYQGSRLHFLRSYYDETLEEEGFVVNLYSPASKTKFAKLANPYESTYYFFDDSTGIAELSFPPKTSISFEKKKPQKRYLEQYKLPAGSTSQVSFVELKAPILIMPNGFFTEQKSWVNQGYWSWTNLADQLPFDYQPAQNQALR